MDNCSYWTSEIMMSFGTIVSSYPTGGACSALSSVNCQQFVP